MTDFLASLSIWTGAVLAVLTVLDWALTDRHKNWLTDRAIALFVWLDDQRELKYLRWLGRFRWQRFVMILYAAFAGFAGLAMAGLISLLLYTGEFDPGQLQSGYGLLGWYVGSFIAAMCMVRIVPRLLNWVTKTEGSLGYIVRSTLALLAILFAFVTSDYLEMYLMTGRSAGMPAEYINSYLPMFGELIGYQPPSANDEENLVASSNPILNFIFGIYEAAWCVILLGILISWMLVVIPVGLILILMLVIRALQFVTARVAESPKGPILGASGLLTAIGGIVKLFL